MPYGLCLKVYALWPVPHGLCLMACASRSVPEGPLPWLVAYGQSLMAYALWPNGLPLLEQALQLRHLPQVMAVPAMVAHKAQCLACGSEPSTHWALASNNRVAVACMAAWAEDNERTGDPSSARGNGACSRPILTYA